MPSKKKKPTKAVKPKVVAAPPEEKVVEKQPEVVAAPKKKAKPKGDVCPSCGGSEHAVLMGPDFRGALHDSRQKRCRCSCGHFFRVNVLPQGVPSEPV